MNVKPIKAVWETDSLCLLPTTIYKTFILLWKCKKKATFHWLFPRICRLQSPRARWKQILLPPFFVLRWVALNLFRIISQTTEMFYSNTGITFVCMVGLDQIKQGNNCYHYYYFISRFNIHIYCLFQHLPARPLCGDICECITRPILMQEMTEEGPKTSLCSRETL